ncbi:MAG: DNA methylase [Clostridia bacterium]|nr:DNA methylase [Clostridia bacterium]
MKNDENRLKKAIVCCDMKSFYASVECVARGLDPLKARLLVADESRSDKTICLAVSPALKAIGVPSRPRLFEAKQAIRLYEATHRTKIDYIIAPPRMAEYIRVSARIYEVFRKYVADADAHVYSIDELFIDVAPYLHLYRNKAEKAGVSPAHYFAILMIRAVLKETGITATVGIGTNLYLAKIAMDIVAKKAKPDKDGVRIAELDEMNYRLQLWTHMPLTDFWQIGPGIARRLQTHGMFTMGDIAAVSLSNEGMLYDLFGINAELLIDHAWGIEPTEMCDIKNYKTEDHSLSTGQVLPRPYKYGEGLLVFREMADLLCADLFSKDLTTQSLNWWVSYDPQSLEECPSYAGPLTVDFYGRMLPKGVHGMAKLRIRTNSKSLILDALTQSFDAKVDHGLLVRRLGIAANDTRLDDGYRQLDLFTDFDTLEKEKSMQRAMLDVRRKYGLNAVVKGMNLLEGATTIERNRQIGGHRAGSPAVSDGSGKYARTSILIGSKKAR